MDEDIARVKKSLRYSIYDGLFASAMTGFTQEYLAPFLISLQASVQQVGMLSAFPNIAAALVQLRSPEITEGLGSRKKTITVFVLLQALTLLPMAGVALSGGRFVTTFIALASFFTVFGAIATPAWGSMMSDLVPEERRGEYFGFRSMLVGMATMAAMFIAGLVIHYGKSYRESFGFFLIFSCAFIFRSGSWYFLYRMYEPPPARSEGSTYRFLDFIRGTGQGDFRRYVVSISLMNFAVNLAGPYFAVLMLRDLGFSYPLYSIIMITAGISVFLAIRRWGMHADRVGNIRVIRSTTKLICFLPLLWIISRNPVYLIVIQVLSGFLWAGFNLAAANFIYDAVPPEHRTRGIAYFNVINGTALFSGALIGGYLADLLPPLLGYPILSLLFLSSVARGIVYLSMIKGLREVRAVPRVRSVNLFFSMIGIKPLLGIERKTLRY